MPFVELPATPLLPGASPARIHYREHGPPDGIPLLMLHGGWGYAFYPFEPQLAALSEFRVIAPDRTGYGQSPRITALPPRFHQAAAAEHEALLDALGVERYAIWGHSDGAIIALLMALRRPARVTRVIVEAVHLDRAKPRSRAFFTQMLEAPDSFGPKVTGRLAADHGDDYWRTVLHAGGRAWLDIAATPDDDFYAVEGRGLSDLACPVLAIHGVDDPRTEPGELDRLAREVPGITMSWVTGGGHSPHSERHVSAEVTAVAASFLRGAPT